jgi:hypothetical protein
MIQLHTCTLVLEYNYSETDVQADEDKGSVWLFAGDGRSSLAQPEPVCELPGWTRIAGPIDLELASSIHAALKSFLESNGVTVIDQGIAD